MYYDQWKVNFRQNKSTNLNSRKHLFLLDKFCSLLYYRNIVIQEKCQSYSKQSFRNLSTITEWFLQFPQMHYYIQSRQPIITSHFIPCHALPARRWLSFGKFWRFLSYNNLWSLIFFNRTFSSLNCNQETTLLRGFMGKTKVLLNLKLPFKKTYYAYKKKKFQPHNYVCSCLFLKSWFSFLIPFPRETFCSLTENSANTGALSIQSFVLLTTQQKQA